MRRARTIKQEELSQSELLRDILDQARKGAPSVLNYDGVTVAVVPVEEITASFSDEELREFLLGWTEAEETDELLTKDEALKLGRERWSKDG